MKWVVGNPVVLIALAAIALTYLASLPGKPDHQPRQAGPVHLHCSICQYQQKR
jgi:hypothetical protein